MKKIYNYIKNRNGKWKFKIIKPYLGKSGRVLDFGCGDLNLSKNIVRNFKKVSITGVDVIDLKNGFSSKRVSFLKYDGKKLPFKKNAFDTTISFYVLHHCDDPVSVVKECARVTKKRIIVVESVPLNSFEIPFMKFFDYFFNVIKFDNTPLPYNFYSTSKWKRIFKSAGFKISKIHHPKSYEDYLPFGKLYVMEFEKN